MKQSFLFILLVSFITSVSGQQYPAYRAVGEASTQAKNFYLLTLLQHNDKVRNQLNSDPLLARITIKQNDAISKSLQSCSDYQCITTNLKLNDDQVRLISARLVELYTRSTALQTLVKDELIPSGAYIKYKDLQPIDQLTKAWEQDAAAINHTLTVYAEGAKPNYPKIDSIAFDVHNTQYIRMVQQVTQQIMAESGSSHLFFVPSMTAALAFLKVNGREDAGNYEPMERTVNQAALHKAATVKWSDFHYTVMLVPGEGPETKEESISDGGIARCKLAADAYQQGLAPFIMVSGGKVHPYKTKYCEAEEMKKYLVEKLNIPESAVIMEPHARHTTTNMRNCVRLLYQYHFPLKQAALVISDVLQSAYISKMDGRCQKELGNVPYQLGTRISPISQEFFAVPDALQINPWEPMDP